jgi:arylsulfatase A-like enzyme
MLRMMIRRRSAIAAILVVLFSATVIAGVRAASPPNIVYILCDDLGYGDVHALNPTRGRILTPHIDRLCAEGMAFTDAHSGSSVCTPTRYGILTGRYAWRTRLQNGVLNGMSPPLIAKKRLTVAELLKEHGYATAMIGKWHLGLEYGPDQWADPLKDGPVNHGFDAFFGISASLDMPPFAWIQNDRFAQPPTVEKKWVRAGPAAKDFEAIDVLPELAQRAVDYIGERAAKAKADGAERQPFFLYLPLASPHTPILPTTEWSGKSGLGAYGDFMTQTDDAVGRVLAAIDAAGIARDTLVLFTSDNGCSPAAKVEQLEAAGHFASERFRGYKADIWEGGHRVPLIARWPGTVKAGSRSDAMVCLTDLMATCADLVGTNLPPTAGEDSVSMLPLLTSRERPATRKSVIHHSIRGVFAIRTPRWKLALCPGSGGWARPTDPQAQADGLPAVQLYDMTADAGETKNVQAEHPDVLRELTALLQKQVDDGRSTPGPAQRNDVDVQIVKPIRKGANE